MFREKTEHRSATTGESSGTNLVAEYDSFRAHIGRRPSVTSVSLHPDSHVGRDLVGVMFNVIIAVLFGGSLVAAWLLH